MAEHDFYETTNMYPNLSANPANGHQFRLKKQMKLKIILLQRLKKEN